MKKLCEELNIKLSIITKEKDRLLEETKKTIVDCEINKTKDINVNAMKIKFEKEKIINFFNNPRRFFSFRIFLYICGIQQYLKKLIL